MDTLHWLTKLISFNTVSSNSNMQLIEAIDVWFKQNDINTQIIPGHSHGLKANLLATIPARNGQTQGGILLSGHTDVVPVAGQKWNTDPFVATEKDGKIYGRGSCDMKGFIAVLLALVPEFKKLHLLKPIHFSFTYDEEIGCIGVDYLLEHLKKIGIQPEGCIVGEPSNMQPITGEKNRHVYHCQVQGLASHASLPNRGCNAIEYASELIWYIHNLADHLKEDGPFDKDFDVPFTTITSNIVSGGTATNIIPGLCEFIFEVRLLPTFPVEYIRNQIEHYIHKEMLPKMRKSYFKAEIYLDKTSDVRGFQALESSQITQIVRQVTGIKDCLKVSYSSEAGIFQDADIPTIICGPGTIEQAHRTNEFISIEQLKMCENMLRKMIYFFCVDVNSIHKT
ncbi:acetylornithine deacetylase [Legionella sp. km535]|uniref:acetylornithine deacetylase n=1 Tax=Legionella sp. km535 TaxID=2498107 RepID=UPI000F8F2CDF|nr:acetylornithine deacetylase [Legionella sp. km535]RUR19321.1 acetylornithine deacetylase [Legionella sp. km535]